MWELHCISFLNGKDFYKKIDNYREKENFIRKCKYSKRIKIVAIINCM